ncbi:MAG: LptF/LptG family permease [Aestuariivirga sp.]|uniref:LptF/LptG family permease n=1 Tax=Aestuariivirga sp. TaxID=2650926 RepID=UPI0038D17EE9
MLRLVDRLVLRHVSLPLAAALVIGMLMLLADRMVRLLDATLGKKSSFTVVFEMLAYLAPHYLGTALPAALFLGLLLGFGRMSANSETDALMATGVGLNRMARPVILLGMLLSALSLAIMGWVQPHARYAYRSVIFEVQNVDIFYLAEEGVFMQAGDSTFILDRLNRADNTFERAFIYHDKGYQGSDTVTAAQGALIEQPDGQRPTLHLKDGHRIVFGTSPARADPPVAGETTEFLEADTPLGRISKDLFRPRGLDERELTLPELFAALDAPPPKATREEVASELSERLVTAASILVLPFLAIPFAVGSRRTARGFRTAAALVLIVAYNEVIQQGASASNNGLAPPLLTMWLPFLLLGAFAGWRYTRTCFTLRNDPVSATIDRAGEFASGLRATLTRRLGWKETA